MQARVCALEPFMSIDRIKFQSLINPISGNAPEEVFVYPMNSGIEAADTFIAEKESGSLEALLEGNGRNASSAAEVPMPGINRFKKS